MKTKSGKTKQTRALTSDEVCFKMGKSRIMLGQFKAEVLDINHAKREIRMLVHTHFTPNEIKTNHEDSRRCRASTRCCVSLSALGRVLKTTVWLSPRPTVVRSCGGYSPTP